MATRKRAKHSMPLIVEPHPPEYEGYPVITLIQFRQQHILTIVDNSDDKTIDAYVLDQCGPARVDEEEIITLAQHWYDNNKELYPISIEFSRNGVSSATSKIYRSFSTEFVSRVIGPLPKFEMSEPISIKRRRRKPINKNVEIKHSNVIKAFD